MPARFSILLVGYGCGSSNVAPKSHEEPARVWFFAGRPASAQMYESKNCPSFIPPAAIRLARSLSLRPCFCTNGHQETRKGVGVSSRLRVSLLGKRHRVGSALDRERVKVDRVRIASNKLEGAAGNLMCSPGNLVACFVSHSVVPPLESEKPVPFEKGAIC